MLQSTVAVVFVGIAAAGLAMTSTAMGNAANWIIGLLNHPDALRMSVGLLSLAIILIVLFGWIRWLVQPLPVQKEEHGHGMKPW